MKTEKKRKETIFSAWKTVFKDWRYVALFLIISFGFYWIYFLLINYGMVSLTYKTAGVLRAIFVAPFIMGFVPKETRIGIAVISLFLGILFSLIIYKFRMIKNVSGKTGAFASVGIFLGVLAPAGCSASCGIGILSIAGISTAAINFIPLGGIGILSISAIILLLSVYKISKDINRGIICEVELPKETIKR